MRVLTIGTLLSMAKDPGPGWTIVRCQFCGERMYCLENNSKVNPGNELVLSCVKCLCHVEDKSVDIAQVHNVPESNPWSDEWKWN